MSNQKNNQVEDLKIDKQEDRKRRWLNHKTKFLTLSYSDSCSKFETEPRFGTLESGLSLSNDKNYQKEVFEVGHLRAELNLEKTADTLLRRVNALKEFVATLENGMLPDEDDKENAFVMLRNYMNEYGGDVFENGTALTHHDASTNLVSSDLRSYRNALRDSFAYSVVKERGNHDILKSVKE